MFKRFAKGGIITRNDKTGEALFPLYHYQKYTRPCKVDGAPATFHRFVENDRGVLQINSFCKPSQVETILMNFKENNFTDGTCRIEKFRETMALIEWPDGRLSAVAVERVQFTDREG